MKEIEKQEDLLLKVKVIRGEILMFQNDIKGLLQTVIDAGGKYSEGVIFKRKPPIGFDDPGFNEPYIYIKTLKVNILHGNSGPFLQFLVQPLTKKLKSNNRYNPLTIHEDLLDLMWTIL